MGGEREDVIQAKSKSAGAAVAEKPAKPKGTATLQPGSTTGLQAIRRHENTARGEVHFHVDAEGIKAYVPTDVWSAAWSDLKERGPGAKWAYIDGLNHTLLEAELALDRSGPTPILEATFVVSKLGPTGRGPTFVSMDEFTEG